MGASPCQERVTAAATAAEVTMSPRLWKPSPSIKKALPRQDRRHCPAPPRTRPPERDRKGHRKGHVSAVVEAGPAPETQSGVQSRDNVDPRHAQGGRSEVSQDGSSVAKRRLGCRVRESEEGEKGINGVGDVMGELVEHPDSLSTILLLSTLLPRRSAGGGARRGLRAVWTRPDLQAPRRAATHPAFSNPGRWDPHTNG
jgi:hypothetical protein